MIRITKMITKMKISVILGHFCNYLITKIRGRYKNRGNNYNFCNFFDFFETEYYSFYFF